MTQEHPQAQAHAAENTCASCRYLVRARRARTPGLFKCTLTGQRRSSSLYACVLYEKRELRYVRDK